VRPNPLWLAFERCAGTAGNAARVPRQAGLMVIQAVMLRRGLRRRGTQRPRTTTTKAEPARDAPRDHQPNSRLVVSLEVVADHASHPVVSEGLARAERVRVIGEARVRPAGPPEPAELAEQRGANVHVRSEVVGARRDFRAGLLGAMTFGKEWGWGSERRVTPRPSSASTATEALLQQPLSATVRTRVLRRVTRSGPRVRRLALNDRWFERAEPSRSWGPRIPKTCRSPVPLEREAARLAALG